MAFNGNTLASLKRGQKGVIEAIDTSDPQVQRLMVLGLVEGAEVVHASAAIGGDPIEFRLFGKVIMEVYTSPLNHRLIVGVICKTGDFYDSKGRPSRTTRERLNGLLDALGTAGFIPEGIRAFLRDDNGCYIGKGEACKGFDAGNTAVAILSHPTDIVFT